MIVALLATARFFIAHAKKTKSRCVRVILLFVFSRLESMVETFNKYAFVQVASRDLSYCAAARDTAALLKQHGLAAIANDDLIDSVLRTAKTMAAFTCACLAAIFAVWWQSNLSWRVVAVLFCVGFVFGWCMVEVPQSIVDVSSATLLVNFAQAPHVMAGTRPEVYASLTAAWAKRHKGEPGGVAMQEKFAAHRASATTKETNQPHQGQQQ